MNQINEMMTCLQKDCADIWNWITDPKKEEVVTSTVFENRVYTAFRVVGGVIALSAALHAIKAAVGLHVLEVAMNVLAFVIGYDIFKFGKNASEALNSFGTQAAKGAAEVLVGLERGFKEFAGIRMKEQLPISMWNVMSNEDAGKLAKGMFTEPFTKTFLEGQLKNIRAWAEKQKQ